MLPYIAEAFAVNTGIRRDIDRIYKKNVPFFHKKAKTSSEYNHPAIAEGSILRLEYGRKMLGILCAGTTDPGISKEILALTQKGWPAIYKAVVESNGRIDIYKTIEKSHKIQNFITLPDDKINAAAYIITFLCLVFGKKMTEESERLVIEITRKRDEFYDISTGSRFCRKNFSREIERKIKILKDRIYQEKYEIKNFRDINPAKDEELDSLAQGLAYLYDAENLSAPALFDEIKFTVKDIEEILGSYYITHKNLNAGEAAKYLTAAMHIKYLLKSYNDLKAYYLKNNKETQFIEIETYRTENEKLRNEITKLQQMIFQQKKDIDKLNKKIDEEYKRAREEFIAKIKEQEKTIKELEKQNAELMQDKNELETLRKSLFSAQPDEIPDIPDGEIHKTINRPEIVIVGGHPSWQQRIKKHLSDITIIETDNQNYDFDIKQKIKLIVFNTAYLNHGIYYKFINFARKNNIKVCYITNQNINRAARQIWAVCKGGF